MLAPAFVAAGVVPAQMPPIAPSLPSEPDVLRDFEVAIAEICRGSRFQKFGGSRHMHDCCFLDGKLHSSLELFDKLQFWSLHQLGGFTLL